MEGREEIVTKYYYLFSKDWMGGTVVKWCKRSDMPVGVLHGRIKWCSAKVACKTNGRMKKIS